jgi:hypothetical protein
VFAIVLSLVDISATGHGWPTLAVPWLDWPALGVHLSRADAVMLGASAIVAGFAWYRSGRRG